MLCQAWKGRMSDWFDQKDIGGAFIERYRKDFYAMGGRGNLHTECILHWLYDIVHWYSTHIKYMYVEEEDFVHFMCLVATLSRSSLELFCPNAFSRFTTVTY